MFELFQHKLFTIEMADEEEEIDLKSKYATDDEVKLNVNYYTEHTFSYTINTNYKNTICIFPILLYQDIDTPPPNS